MLTIPDDFGNLYDYPAAALNTIRRTMSKDLDLYLEGPSKVGLFLYDNSTVIVENFNDEPVDVRLVGMKPGALQLTDLESGKAAEPAMKIMPHSYRAFRFFFSRG